MEQGELLGNLFSYHLKGEYQSLENVKFFLDEAFKNEAQVFPVIASWDQKRARETIRKFVNKHQMRSEFMYLLCYVFLYAGEEPIEKSRTYDMAKDIINHFECIEKDKED